MEHNACDNIYSSPGIWNPRVLDYDYARTRSRPHVTRHFERGYIVAEHFAEQIAKRRHASGRLLETAFREHVEKWKKETRHWSSITKMIAHPSYLRIIGLSGMSSGHRLERLLLHELHEEPDHWFAALTAITGEDPVRPRNNFDGAVKAWLAWGQRKGLV
jgi:hypothetical protein